MKIMRLCLCVLLALLLMGCFAVLASAEGTFENSTVSSYCENCDVTVTSGRYDSDTHCRVCPGCGQDTEGADEHNASCDNPDVCLDCGMSGVNIAYVLCCGDGVMKYSSDYHWSVCEFCGEYLEYPSTHAADCDAPEKCNVCGQTDVKIADVEHSYNLTIGYNQTQHWYACPDCGEAIYTPQNHWSRCGEDRCYECGQTGVTIANVRHRFGWESEYVKVNSEYCVALCTNCGIQNTSYVPHAADCKAPTVCTRCKASGISASVSHQYGGEYASDKDYHWKACVNCGEPDRRILHTAYCEAPNTCTRCGAEGVNARIVRHGGSNYYSDFIFKYNQTHCWSVCEVCGAKEAEIRHYTTNCLKPNLCEDCGTDNVDCLVFHSYETFDPSGGHFYLIDPQYDERGHWWNCTRCGDHAIHPHEYDEDDICVVCGYEKPEQGSRPRLPGDADDNGKVELDDAVLVLQHVADRNVYLNASNANVNADGKVDLYDALLLLQYAAGWNVALK